MNAWAEAINHNNADALADVFAIDAEFINLFGSVWQGRQEIIDGHAWALNSVLHDSSMHFETIHEHTLDERITAVRGVCRRKRSHNASAETLEPGSTVMLMIARRDADGWTAVAGANIARPTPRQAPTR